jgi:hypothetical protein
VSTSNLGDDRTRLDPLSDEGWPDASPPVEYPQHVPSRWWHWRLLRWAAAAVLAAGLPVYVALLTFWVLSGSEWPAAQAGAASGLAAAPWAWLGGQLAGEAVTRWRATR